MSQLLFPDPVRVGSRTVRRWDVVLASSISSRVLDELGQMLTRVVEMIRREAFGTLGRDLTVFDALVVVRLREGDQRAEVEVSYVMEGAIGDCEMMALWLPLRVLRAMFGIVELQGKEARLWRVFFL